MNIIMNPGAGAVPNASLENATANMAAFVNDIGIDGVNIERLAGWSKYDKGGRFYFQINGLGQTSDIEMPGVPLDRVRYIQDDGQNIWDFPRLYVDGSSWVWKYGVEIAQSHLTRPDDDE